MNVSEEAKVSRAEKERRARVEVRGNVMRRDAPDAPSNGSRTRRSQSVTLCFPRRPRLFEIAFQLLVFQ